MDTNRSKLDTSHLASADIADKILENYEEAERNYDLSWKRINGEDWARILIKLPQLADKCDWSEVTTYDWVELLRERPEFVDLRTDEYWKAGMWKALDERDWTWLLEAQPQLAKYRPEQLTDTESQSGKSDKNGKLDTSHLASADIADKILENYEEAERNYDLSWKRINGEDWVRILTKLPQLADKCDWERMRSQWKGLDWVRLLEAHPQFADQCRWASLEGDDWADLLAKQPQFADRCRWASLNGYDWAELLAEQPQFADKFDWKMLRDYHDFCDDPDYFDEDEYRRWERLFSVHGQFVDKCAWTKLNGEDWAHLLSVHPQLFCKCDWTKLNGKDWAHLLSAQPQFSYKCDKWDEIPAKGPYLNSRPCWLGLLERQPWFADKCDKWGEFDESDWAELLRIQPQFADKRGKKPSHEPTKLLQFTISGVRGRPIELGRRLMKDGDDQYESGWGVNGVIPDSTLFANGEPGATMLQVSLDGEIVFERRLDFSKPEGLVFEDCGSLYDENEDPGDGWWLYGAERWAGVTWSPWTMEVPDNFQFDPGKLTIPFYHARIDDESEPRLVFRPCEISYDGHKAAGEGLEWNDQTHSGGVAYWTVEAGVASRCIMPDCY